MRPMSVFVLAALCAMLGAHGLEVETTTQVNRVKADAAIVRALDRVELAELLDATVDYEWRRSNLASLRRELSEGASAERVKEITLEAERAAKGTKLVLRPSR